MSRSGDSRRSRQGIALVVVLGFLAVLTLMAVGMAISMRTERLASSSHLNMVKARVYCNAALADSMLWLEEFLSRQSAEYKDFMVAPHFKEVASYWADEEQSDGDIWSRGMGNLLPSRDPENNNDTFATSLVDGIGTNYAPYLDSRSLWDIPKTEEDVEKLGAQWIHVKDSNGELVGRYMYLIFTDTTNLDLNYQHREIVPGFRLGGDKDLFDYQVSSIESVYHQRDNEDLRYETVRDFFSAHGLSSVYNGGHDTGMFFNYAPPMRPIQVVRENGINRVEYLEDESYPVDILGEVSRWEERREQIENAFEIVRNESRWSSADGAATAADLYEMLVDYVDDDFTPYGGNHDRPSVEPVPMINEVRLGADRIDVEVWAPFVGNTHYTANFQLVAVVGGTEYTSAQSALQEWSNPVEPAPPMVISIPIDPPLTEEMYDIEVYVRGGVGDLDKVGIAGFLVGKYAQVDDPRFNHVESQWLKNTSAGTLGRINSNVSFADNGQNPGNSYVRDGDYHMYTANRPLDCTGDLGYLPVAPWRTLKLYEDMRNNVVNMDPVLNYFTMQTNTVPGMINANDATLWARSLDAVFDTYDQVDGGYLGMYLEDRDTNYKGGAFLHRKCMSPYVNAYHRDHGFAMNFRTLYTWNNQVVLNIADVGEMLFSNKARHNTPRPKPIQRLVDFKNRSRTDPQYSELRLQHLMRRASALVNIRQNLLMICIWAQAVGPAPQVAGQPHSYPVLAEAQAFALVWRDPYPDDDGHHRKFVRYIRWME